MFIIVTLLVMENLKGPNGDVFLGDVPQLPTQLLTPKITTPQQLHQRSEALLLLPAALHCKRGGQNATTTVGGYFIDLF